MKLKQHVPTAFALIAFARKIGFRRARRLAALAADVYIAQQVLKRRKARPST
jgi:hypothetical protein